MTDIARERAFLGAQGLDIIEREQWNAVQSYTSDRTVEEPVRWFFLHISVTPDPADTPSAEAAACRQVEAIGQSRFGIGCSYNAATMQSGRLYEMQPLTRRGAHTVNDKDIAGFPTSLNYAGRACVLVQNVQDAVTDAQIDSAARWAAAQIRAGYARPDAQWFGHRDFAFKSCPGDAGYARLPEIRELTAFYVAVGLNPQEDSLSAAEVAQIVTHIDNTVRPFLVKAPTAAAVFVDNRDGTLTWVDSQDMLKAVRLDGVQHAGTQPDGVTPTPFTSRTEAHLRSLHIVGPVPDGWE